MKRQHGRTLGDVVQRVEELGGDVLRNVDHLGGRGDGAHVASEHRGEKHLCESARRVDGGEPGANIDDVMRRDCGVEDALGRAPEMATGAGKLPRAVGDCRDQLVAELGGRHRCRTTRLATGLRCICLLRVLRGLCERLERDLGLVAQLLG